MLDCSFMGVRTKDGHYDITSDIFGKVLFSNENIENKHGLVDFHYLSYEFKRS